MAKKKGTTGARREDDFLVQDVNILSRYEVLSPAKNPGQLGIVLRIYLIVEWKANDLNVPNYVHLDFYDGPGNEVPEPKLDSKGVVTASFPFHRLQEIRDFLGAKPQLSFAYPANLRRSPIRVRLIGARGR